MSIIAGAPFFNQFSTFMGDAYIPRAFNQASIGASRDTLVSEYARKSDTVFISAAGRQMHLHISEDDNVNKSASPWEQVTNSGHDKTLKLIDKHISTAGKLLEQMKAVAEAARDDSLDDLDRMDLQIQMGQLQHELDRETDVMNSLYQASSADKAYSTAELMHGKFSDSEAGKMLLRARERIINGEDWNVAEKVSTIVKDGPEGLVVVGYEWEVTDDENVPTVGDILKARGRSLMDSKSAAVSSAELEKSLKNLAKQREGFIAFIEKNGGRSPEDDESYGKSLSILFSRVQQFLGSLARDAVVITYGPKKDEDGNIIDVPDFLPTVNIETVQIASEGGVSISAQKTDATAEMEATILQVQLSNRSLGWLARNSLTDGRYGETKDFGVLQH
jgi:ribosomal protein L24